MPEGIQTNTWTTDEKTSLVIAILSGDLTETEAAARHRLDASTIVEWKSLYLAALKQGVSASGAPVCKRRRRFGALMSAAAALIVLSVSGVVLSAAASEECTGDNTLLCLFNPGSPARASQINSNFAKLKGWLTDKTGPLDSPDITAYNADIVGELTAEDAEIGGSITAGSGNIAGAMTVGGNLTVSGDIVGGVDKITVAGPTGDVFEEPESQTFDLGSRSNRFCAVSSVHSDGHGFVCYIRNNGSNYELYAQTWGGWVGCWANCLTWDE